MSTGTLPDAGKKIFEKIYQERIKAGDTPEIAAKKAWGGVHGAGWAKVGDKWVKKSDVMPEFSMFISKLPKAWDDNADMKFAMVASDTLLDQHGEAMSQELYANFLSKIEDNVPPPEQFAPYMTSDWWKGGMPYVSLSHYPDLNGDAVPADPTVVYTDGRQLKVKGKFRKTPLGKAVCKSLIEDSAKPADQRIRTSIAFLDLKHKHGDFVFERKSLEDTCPMCAQNAGDKVYLDGYLVHFALTRVPVNPRTPVQVELSMPITRKEDALSIVGDEKLVDEIEEKQKALVGRSDLMVERADTEPDMEDMHEGMETGTMAMESVAVVTSSVASNGDTVTMTDTSTITVPNGTPVVEEARKDVTPADKKRAEKKYGDVTYADPANKKYPVDDEEHIKAAWSYIHMPKNAAKYSPAQVASIKKKIVAAWKRVIGGEPPAVSEKSLLEEEAEQAKTLDELLALPDPEEVYNPQQPPSAPPTVEEMLGEILSILRGKSEVVTPLEKQFTDLRVAVKSAVEAQGTEEEKLRAIQPFISQLGEAIVAQVKTTAAPAEKAVEKPQTSIETALSQALQPIAEKLSILEAKMQERPVTEKSIPRPRSAFINPMDSLIKQPEKKFSPIEQIVRRSVGLEN